MCLQKPSIPIFFFLTDVGIMLKDSLNLKFLYHSTPIKIIHFAAAKKPFVSTPIKWLEENQFPNIFILPVNVNGWIKVIKQLMNFLWNNDWDALWSPYDWKILGKTLAHDIGKQGRHSCVSAA